MSRESDEVGEQQFWGQFRDDPDYPDLSTTTDFRDLEWYKDWGNGI